MRDHPEIPAPLIVTGHGLLLREWDEEDLPDMVDLFDDPQVALRTPLAAPFTLSAARDYLGRARVNQADGRQLQLAITTDGGRAKGEVRLNRSTGTISYIVGAAHRGQRLATRALLLMTEYTHEELGLSQVSLEIEPDNHPSVAVARAAGFRLTNAPPEVVTVRDRSYTLHVWSHQPSA
ncbi:GNAT family N-acetyltransferase [Nonomuraea sp. NPDC048882]|uniref:GNAT family N-acetyltransferase n=1 Tax=Nonomuraea sp. NPDC048882 TaxID=3154347 RepID=UPI000A8964ED